jgi:hypothetical protein
MAVVRWSTNEAAGRRHEIHTPRFFSIPRERRLSFCAKLIVFLLIL